MTSTLLDERRIGERLAELSSWEREGEAIRKEYRFDGFAAAMIFVNRVAELAERADHHPDIDVRYDRVLLRLTTHDSHGLTERDFALAARIDA